MRPDPKSLTYGIESAGTGSGKRRKPFASNGI